MNYYRDLLRQGPRIEAFRQAINTMVDPEDRVLEIGTGLGTYSFFAADAGAARVWAVEGAPIVHVAEAVAKLNGYGDRIEFVRGWVPDISIPERATVLIYEDFAPRLLGSTTYRILTHARERYLTPDARWIPHRARMCVAPICAEKGRPPLLAPLGQTSDEAYGIDWTPTREYVFNTPHHESVAADALVAPPEILADFRLGDLPEVATLGGTTNWRLDCDALIGGLAYWFDMELVQGEWLSNAPGASPCSWGQLVLPLDPPIAVMAGKELSVGVAPDRLMDGAPGWLSWWATSGDTKVRGHEFAAEPVSFADLYERSPDGAPSLSAKGRIETAALQLVDGKRSVAEIAAELEDAVEGWSEVDAVHFVLRILEGRVTRTTLSDALAQRGIA